MLVEDSEDFLNIDVDDTVTLDSDITIPESFETLSKFNGVFNGRGHTISNLDSMFINTVCDDAVIKNVNFKDVDLDVEKGIFAENNGEINSVTVTNLERDDTNVSYNNSIYENGPFGGIVGYNKGIVKYCSISDFQIISSYAVGGIVGVCDSGEVKSCIVIDGSLESTAVGLSSNGGLCGSAKNRSLITDCAVRDISSETATSSSFGGIVGSGSSSIIQNSTVSGFLIKAKGYDVFGGIAIQIDGSDSEIKSCTVENINLEGIGSISLIGNLTDGGLLKSCSVKNMDVNSIFVDSLSVSMSKYGVLEECNGEEITIKTRNLEVGLGENSVKDCSLSVSASVSSDISVDTVESKNSFIDITQDYSNSPDIVHISDKSDIDSTMTDSTIILKNDIDMGGQTIPIEIFTGRIKGNGNKIYNFKSQLFSVLDNAVIKNVSIQSDNMYPSLFSKVSDSTLENVELTIDNSGTSDGKLTPVEDIISNSTVKNCTFSIDVDTDRTGVYGLSHKLSDSKVINCDFNLCVTNRTVYGVSSTSFESKIKNCTVSGRIAGNSVAGLIKDLIDSSIIQTYCGLEIIREGDELKENAVGGFCNNIKGQTSLVKSCKFTGSIKYQRSIDLSPCGGIVGSLQTGSVKKCVNKGHITALSSGIGGICGENIGGMIQKCVNTAEIEGIDYVGGLIGVLGANPNKNVKITTEPVCEKSGNKGSINGSNRVGGIIGFFKDTTVKNCYNFGTVDGESNTSLSIGMKRKETGDSTIRNILVTNQTDETVEIGSMVDGSIEEVSMLLGL